MILIASSESTSVPLLERTAKLGYYCIKKDEESVMSTILREIEERKSRRAISGKTVPEESITRIMRAATLAPSCFNNQPWRFLIINKKEALEKVKKALSKGNYWAREAPLFIVVVTKPDADCRLNDRREYALFDTGLAAENCILQAVREGLVAHPIAGFNPMVLKEEFGIPQEYIIITVIVIGFHGELSGLSEEHIEAETAPGSRLPEERVMSYNKWEL
jgi:nitroreductase